MNWLVNFFYKKAVSENLKNRVALIKTLIAIYERVYLDETDRKELKKAIYNMRSKNDNATCDNEGNVYFYYDKVDKNGNIKKVKDKTKITKYLRKNLETNISNSGLGRITNHFSTLLQEKIEEYTPKPPEFSIGKDIQKKYIDYSGESCMKKHDAAFVELYALNPNKVKLLTYKDLGKTLIWYCDDGSVVMDRIYADDNRIFKLFKQYARKNNIIMKGNSNTASTEFEDGKERTVTLNKWSKFFPYIDTFCCGEFYKDNEVSNPDNADKLVLNNFGEGSCVFRQTNGEFLMDGEGYKNFTCLRCNIGISFSDINSGYAVERNGGSLGKYYLCNDCIHCAYCNKEFSIDDISIDTSRYSISASGIACKECFNRYFKQCCVCEKIRDDRYFTDIDNLSKKENTTSEEIHEKVLNNLKERKKTTSNYICFDCVISLLK